MNTIFKCSTSISQRTTLLRIRHFQGTHESVTFEFFSNVLNQRLLYVIFNHIINSKWTTLYAIITQRIKWPKRLAKNAYNNLYFIGLVCHDQRFWAKTAHLWNIFSNPDSYVLKKFWLCNKSKMFLNMEYLKETTYVNLRYFNFHLSQINYLK